MTPAELMLKAEQAIESGHVLLGRDDLEGAVNRAYYGMFHAARAILAHRGIDTEGAKHGTVIGLFGQHFVKSGDLPRELGRALNQVQVLRTQADYGGGLRREDADFAVASARGFVKAVRDLAG